MSGGMVLVLVLIALALLLRTHARTLVGRSTRPEHVVHIDTGRNERLLISHRYRLTGRPDYILPRPTHLRDRGRRPPQ